MKYTLIWPNGAILDNKLVYDNIQDACAAKKVGRGTVRLLLSVAACVTMWAVEWDIKPNENGANGLIYGGFRHFVAAGLSRAEAFRRRLQLDAANATNVNMYEYVRQIID